MFGRQRGSRGEQRRWRRGWIRGGRCIATTRRQFRRMCCGRCRRNCVSGRQGAKDTLSDDYSADCRVALSRTLIRFAFVTMTGPYSADVFLISQLLRKRQPMPKPGKIWHTSLGQRSSKTAMQSDSVRRKGVGRNRSRSMRAVTRTTEPFHDSRDFRGFTVRGPLTIVN